MGRQINKITLEDSNGKRHGIYEYDDEMEKTINQYKQEGNKVIKIKKNVNYRGYKNKDYTKENKKSEYSNNEWKL